MCNSFAASAIVKVRVTRSFDGDAVLVEPLHAIGREAAPWPLKMASDDGEIRRIARILMRKW
ncbi:MAG TPA: hypothetical protein VNR65_01770, partial [Geobacterales bacterium]|nr:hypothetical protein [Geobacterales bacterium]